MCLFPYKNLNEKSAAYRAGVREFECGACPECLQKRSASWALRAVHEARLHVHSCMVTLTYDTFKYGNNGEILGENPVNPNLVVNKRDIQLFIKRLRKHFENQDENIKYIVCAEYGSRTHRAHYHALLFGVDFKDKAYYKRSKRGNPIYMSKTLTDLWSHGIATIDCINATAATARYCTKYCAKSRSDQTFMLFSQSLGLASLYSDFLQNPSWNSFFIDGREFPIPRFIWQKYISEKYKCFQVPFDFRYKNHNYDLHPDDDFEYNYFKRLRENYRMIRDRDDRFVDYILYWREKQKRLLKHKQPVVERIYALDERKYHNYKAKAFSVLSYRLNGIPAISPGSGCKSRMQRYLTEHGFYMDEFEKIHVNIFEFHIPVIRRYFGDSVDDVYVKSTCQDTALLRYVFDNLCEFNGFPPRKFFVDDDDFDIFEDLPVITDEKIKKVFSHLPCTPRHKTASDTKDTDLLTVSSVQIAIEDIFDDI